MDKRLIFGVLGSCYIFSSPEFLPSGQVLLLFRAMLLSLGMHSDECFEIGLALMPKV